LPAASQRNGPIHPFPPTTGPAGYHRTYG